jgi:hypothetical protein
MKKYFFYSVCIAFLGATGVSAQNAESQFSAENPKSNRIAFKPVQPTQDKTDLFEIQSIGGTTFTASNTSDGSANSFKHSLQVVMTLVPVNKTGITSFQLNFYSENDNIQQAATFTDGVLNIYYPVAVYEDIRIKLEQALAARKKVTVKVTQKTNGYREGVLVL